MLPRHHNTVRHSRLRQRPAITVHTDHHLEELRRNLGTETRTLREELQNLHDERRTLQ